MYGEQKTLVLDEWNQLSHLLNLVTLGYIHLSTSLITL